MGFNKQITLKAPGQNDTSSDTKPLGGLTSTSKLGLGSNTLTTGTSLGKSSSISSSSQPPSAFNKQLTLKAPGQNDTSSDTKPLGGLTSTSKLGLVAIFLQQVLLLVKAPVCLVVLNHRQQ